MNKHKFEAGIITFHVVPHGYEADVTVHYREGKEEKTFKTGGMRSFMGNDGADFFVKLLQIYELGEAFFSTDTTEVM